MMLRGRGNDEVGEAWRKSGAAGPVRQGAGDTGAGEIEGENSVCVEMHDCFKPEAQAAGFGCGAGSYRFGDAVFDFGNRDNGEKNSWE